jgi:hypothetical protein
MGDFEHDATFQATAVSGNLELDKYEVYYQQLLSEAMEDGVITAEERAELERAASSLGLDPKRLVALEKALLGAYETHHGVEVLETGAMFAPVDREAAAEAAAAAATETETPQQTIDRLLARVGELETRVKQLEDELESARENMAIEVDFSDVEMQTIPPSDVDALHRRLKHDPRDAATLKALFNAFDGDVDRQWCIAQALVFLERGDEVHRTLYEQHQSSALIQPTSAIDGANWQRLLHHPEDEPITGEILSLIVSPVLLGHISAMRHAGTLPTLDPKRRIDGEDSTVQAGRCFNWAGQLLGTSTPPLYAEPSFEGLAQMVPGVPPSSVLGKKALSGRDARELAFIAGRHLAFYRQDRFIRLLVPSIVDLEDVFLAALLIARPQLPVAEDVRKRVTPVSAALESMLEATDIDRLRGSFMRFVEAGGRTNLQRWAFASDATAQRTGLLLCNDLGVAKSMLELSDPHDLGEAVDDLLVFSTSARYAELRKTIGIAIG